MTKTVLVTAMVATMAACGDPKTPPNAIVVTFDPTFPPPTSLNTSAYAGIAADVANDVKNAGVNFSCVPDTPAGTCGTFTPPGAGTAVPVCYLAPAQVPPGGKVTLTALSNRSDEVYIGFDHDIEWRCRALPVTRLQPWQHDV